MYFYPSQISAYVKHFFNSTGKSIRHRFTKRKLDLLWLKSNKNLLLIFILLKK